MDEQNIATQSESIRQKPKSRLKKKTAPQAPLMKVGELESLLKSIKETSAETTSQIKETLAESGRAYLMDESKKIYAVAITPAELERLAKNSQ